MLIGMLRFANGVVGVLDVNWLTPTKIRELSVLGERGMFVVDYLARELRFYENDAHPRVQTGDWAARGLKGVSEGPVHVLKVEKRESLRVELEAFVASGRRARRDRRVRSARARGADRRRRRARAMTPGP
jgi:predicted dehydrogenase